MHPKEYKQEKAATGRFTHLCLKNSEIHMGVCFDDHQPVQGLIRDPRYFPVLLYPGTDAVALSDESFPTMVSGDRRLLVFLLDATWTLARKMFSRSRTLQSLPRLKLVPRERSRYLIKKQPHDWCLSTIEAAHELMKALEKAGLDNYPRPRQMLELFARMQEYQIACMRNPALQNYRPGEGRRFT